MDTLTPLSSFRAAAYAAFSRRRDALFELCDTLRTTGPVPSLPLLSMQPQHQRGWGSLYDALAVGEVSVQRLEHLLASHPLAGGEPIYAVDTSVWPRCDAETSPERALYYHASRHSAGQPIVAGWAYSWIAQVGFARESWTAPLRVRRLRPQENANAIAAEQIAAFLPHRQATDPLPWFLFDAGYDPVQLSQALGSTPAAILVRLRSGRCFYADPTAQPRTGRPRRHGHKFIGDAPSTWPTPADEVTVEDAQYGTVRVRAWTGLHPKTHGQHAQRDARGRRPIVRGTLLLVEVSRLPGQTRQPQALWLWWHTPQDGDSIPNLDRAWRAYVRRFAVEQTFPFLKQTLNWTLPRVRYPARALPCACATLRVRYPAQALPCAGGSLDVARRAGLHAIASRPPAGRRPPASLAPSPAGRKPHSPTGPTRVCDPAPATLLLRRPILASPPHPCGRSPGRPKGKRSGRATRYPAITKAILAATQAA
jgi:PAS domain-containing protein